MNPKAVHWQIIFAAAPLGSVRWRPWGPEQWGKSDRSCLSGQVHTTGCHHADGKRQRTRSQRRGCFATTGTGRTDHGPSVSMRHPGAWPTPPPGGRFMASLGQRCHGSWSVLPDLFSHWGLRWWPINQIVRLQELKRYRKRSFRALIGDASISRIEAPQNPY